MPTSIDEAVKRLQSLFKRQLELQEEFLRLSDVVTSPEAEVKVMPYYQQLREAKREVWTYVQDELLRYPPYHLSRHAEKLKIFHDVAPYEKSVFIMTKFPEGTDQKDLALKKVIEAVQSAINEAGMTPRIATFGYQDWLWDNVELYLVGCARGIAIVEDRYRQELNPNVALEWGWMKGMGKKVLFLIEEQFANQRADWQGLLSKTFRWDAPAEDVRGAVLAWLTGTEKV